jgi:hypothetical protein
MRVFDMKNKTSILVESAAKPQREFRLLMQLSGSLFFSRNTSWCHEDVKPVS